MNTAKPQWVTNNKIKYATNKVFDYGQSKWKKFARHHKNNAPYCAHCKLEGKTKLGEVSDHIIPINSGGSLWDLRNLQNLCRIHDNMKRSREGRGVIGLTIGEYGDYLPATSLDLYGFDIYWNTLHLEDVPLIYQETKNTIILGPPASGKTTLSYKLSHELNINIINSDDYLDDVNTMIDQCKALVSSGKSYHIEGSQAQHMIEQSNKYKPQVVIWIDCNSMPELYRRYKTNRDIRKFDNAISNYYIRMYDTLKLLESNGHNVLKYRIVRDER